MLPRSLPPSPPHARSVPRYPPCRNAATEGNGFCLQKDAKRYEKGPGTRERREQSGMKEGTEKIWSVDCPSLPLSFFLFS